MQSRVWQTYVGIATKSRLTVTTVKSIYLYKNIFYKYCISIMLESSTPNVLVWKLIQTLFEDTHVRSMIWIKFLPGKQYSSISPHIPRQTLTVAMNETRL